jgi:dolichyl-phosphate beta-glucosyltransferase
MIFIILPVKNESQTIDKNSGRIIHWCKKNFKDEFYLLYVNDHSTDDTPNKLRSIGFEHLRMVNNLNDPGKGSALKFGYLCIKNQIKEDDIVVFLDGDGQIDVAEIKTFLNLMQLYNADVVIGNKRHDYSMIEYTFIRRIVSNSYNLLIRKLFGFNLRDTQCGIKMFKKSVLENVISKITTKRFAFDIELIMAMRALRYRIVDAPVRINHQINGGSVSFKNIRQTFYDTLKIWIRTKNNFYSSEL